MKQYEVRNAMSGHSFGAYGANSPEAAFEVLAHEAGYSSYAEACRVAPVQLGELTVTEVNLVPSSRFTETIDHLDSIVYDLTHIGRVHNIPGLVRTLNHAREARKALVGD